MINEESARTWKMLETLGHNVRETALTVLWAQWRAVGGMAASRPAASLVDPEALVLISLVFEPEEPRLADILGDWISLNAELLSIQRLRTLARAYPKEIQARLAAVARIAMLEGKDHRWKVLANDAEPDLMRRRNKMRAVPVPSLSPPALVLRLRRAIGVSVKADVCAVALGQGDETWLSVNAIARETGYTVPAVRRAINDLSLARWMDTAKSDSRLQVRTPTPRWAAFLRVKLFAPWRSWHDTFVLVTEFLNWMTLMRDRPLTPFAVVVHARKVFEPHMALLQQRHGWQWPDTAGNRDLDDPSPLIQAVDNLTAFMLREV